MSLSISHIDFGEISELFTLEFTIMKNSISTKFPWCCAGMFISIFLMALAANGQNFNPNIYYRLVAKHNGKVLHVDISANGGMDDQADVVVRDWYGGDNQRWKIESTGDGAFRLVAKHSGKVLDVNLGQDNQANVVQAGWHGGDNQRWKIESTGDGAFRLIAKHSGRALDVNMNEYANVVQHDWHGGDNQRWRIEPAPDGGSGSSSAFNPNYTYRLIAKHNGKVLHVDGGTDDQVNVTVRDWYGGDNQRWKIESTGDGAYRLIARHSGKVLDVNLGMDNQANVVQAGWHGGDNQRWIIEPVGDGYYRLIAKHSRRTLDVNMDESANVVQHDWHGGDNQRWKIEQVSDTGGGSGGGDLTGFWKDDNGSNYQIRQVGNKIWWYMDGLPEVNNIFVGTVSGNTISGEWTDLPGGNLRNTGSLKLRIVSNNRLEKISESMFYGGSVFTRK